MGYYDRYSEAAVKLREQYPEGCRVELIEMDDDFAPPPGTLGTVMAIDDMATIHVRWDDGSCLGVAFEIDRVRKVADH